MADADRALREWVEELAMLYEREGLPRMAGRIFGWLLVCEPPEQTMEQLAGALQGSKASMSTMTRLLVTAGLVERVRPPGARRDGFRIPHDHWTNMWRSRTQALSAAAAVIARGRALVAGRPAEARRRLDEIHDLYRWFEKEYPRLLSRWERERRPRRRPPRVRLA
ncbi:MAG TPA: MarR family transcriptional regulator [Anaeromyxobacteraceae bacterium]|nr:MarR family transcriptional regulator [Anaeromyxobacteraceae bacterium]